ncbi:MAG: hypothetical protein LJE74_06775 [Proteobacteria bacterium]|jgi:IS30 family transposase|nr:hypothetical protein [Pseudomonadota bacterium]MCG6935293.1 hypothetical protein [Pseudomonadota bacterium]
MTYFLFSTIVLAFLLFFPVSKLVWTLSVRRLQRKLQCELSPEEIQGQLSRARFIAIFFSLIFSFLFNNWLIGIPGNG